MFGITRKTSKEYTVESREEWKEFLDNFFQEDIQEKLYNEGHVCCQLCGR